jgi:hypothetical protein
MKIILNLVTFAPLIQKLWNKQCATLPCQELYNGMVPKGRAVRGPHNLEGLQHGHIQTKQTNTFLDI